MYHIIKPKRLKVHIWSIVLGIVMLGYVTLRIFLYKEDNNLWHYWYTLFYFPAAVIFIIDGSGYTFGRYSIEINDKTITATSGLIFTGKQSLFWNEITRIEIQKKRLYFQLKNDKNTFIQTIRIPDNNLTQLIKILTETAKTKRIEVKNVA